MGSVRTPLNQGREPGKGGNPDRRLSGEEVPEPRVMQSEDDLEPVGERKQRKGAGSEDVVTTESASGSSGKGGKSDSKSSKGS